jgi:hypothetical protein
MVRHLDTDDDLSCGSGVRESDDERAAGANSEEVLNKWAQNKAPQPPLIHRARAGTGSAIQRALGGRRMDPDED